MIAGLLSFTLFSTCATQARDTQFVRSERLEMHFSTWVEGDPGAYVRKGDLMLHASEGVPFDQARIVSWVDANGDDRRDPGEWRIVWESARIEGGTVELSLDNAILSRCTDKRDVSAEEFLVEVDSGDGFEPMSGNSSR